ncbi:MAG: hypothetical protein JO161_10240 [Planctomycetaceae bacterium]|nr:hypothetical protein [Planctomycetaceae bacterium]
MAEHIEKPAEPSQNEADRLASAALIVRRLESGEALESLGFSALEVITALGRIGLEGKDGLGPSLVQQPPTRPHLASALSEPALARLLTSSTRPARLALAAGLLQIYDFWDRSHQAAQEADDLSELAFSAYWHGIAHRREPDAGNAAYWFRRVGRHPLFEPLGREASRIFEAHDLENLVAKIVARGSWDPMAMIDFCIGALPGSQQELLARRLQRLEMQLLLAATAGAIIPAMTPDGMAQGEATGAE